MELTLEQQAALQRGEVVTLHVPSVAQDCVLMHRERFLKMQEELNEEHEMQGAREYAKSLLSASKLSELVKDHRPPASWHDEDHSDLVNRSLLAVEVLLSARQDSP